MSRTTHAADDMAYEVWYVYRGEFNAGSRLGHLRGTFDTREDAQAAIDSYNLPGGNNSDWCSITELTWADHWDRENRRWWNT